ncbi:sugar ABC transporter permease [Actinopolymorpha sp. NPDC004070]|uniref:carbohydrate ABC transporter permease n=1 Tax=Actinopolymorpha sp. NPDC004070 TaxID=3154548 RepID=UPI0033B482C0
MSARASSAPRRQPTDRSANRSTTGSRDEAGTRVPQRFGLVGQEWRNQRNGILFISPWIIGFLVFSLGPMLASLYFSFTSYNVLKAPRWIGVQNYVNIFAHDPYLRTAVVNTLYLAVLGVSLGTLLSLVLAMLLNQRVKGIGIYRTLYYLPTMLPIVVSSFIFLLVLDPQFGVINNFLALFGIPGPGWLSSPDWSKPALIVLGLWGVGNSVVIYLAGLQDVPRHLMEAAEVDGAGWWRRLVHVTLPMLSPVIFFNVVLAIIAAFQNFVSIFFLTDGTGGPARSTVTWGLQIYTNAFVNGRMGYASAMSWIMFVIVLLVTLALFRLGSHIVYYEGAEGSARRRR